jgi:hypothetical protein
MDSASLRPDFGVGVILKPGGIRPSAIFCRNVSSLETASLEIDLVAARNTRTKCAVRHDVISFEGETVTPEQAIEFAKRVFDKRGYGTHAQILVTHEDTDHIHVHCMTAAIDARTLKPLLNAYSHDEMHLATRQVELEMGMKHDHGNYVFDETTQTIRKSTKPERLAWEQARNGNRLERLAKVNGLATYRDRVDRVNRDINDLVEQLKHANEQILMVDLHLIAARAGIALEAGPGGSIIANAQGPKVEGEEPVKLSMRVTGGQLPTQDVAERQLVAHLRRNPGRLARDLIRSGKAVFSREEIDGYLVDRLGDPDIQHEIGDYVIAQDHELRMLSPDVEFALFTTAALQQAEQRLIELATKLAQTPNPHYTFEACETAIARTEAEVGYALTDEQRAAAHNAYSHCFSVTQGTAGSGKTSTVAVVGRHLAEISGAPIAGFSTAANASEKLASDAGFKADNTARAATHAKRDHKEMTAGGFALYDEVSAADVERSVEMFESAIRTKTCVSGIGDYAQINSPSAGDVMGILIDLTKRLDRYAEITQVHRQQKGSEVEWMRSAVPLGTEAILACDRAGVRAYFEELWNHGHVESIEDDRERVVAKAQYLAAEIRAGERPISTDNSRDFAYFTNKAVREELGHHGKHRYGMKNGVRDFVPGDRVVFEKNNEKLNVKNGYTGEVKEATPDRITVHLDGGRDVTFNPQTYTALDWGYVVTHFKSQGHDAPQAVPTIGHSDNARTANVAITRARSKLKVFTPLPRDEFLDRLSSASSLRLPPDAILYARMVERFGGPESPWARAMKRAQEHAQDPLRAEHDAFCTERTAKLDAAKTTIQAGYRQKLETAHDPSERRTLRAQRDAAIRAAIDRFGALTFVQWGIANRGAVEHGESRRQKVADLSEHRQKTVRQTIARPEQTIATKIEPPAQKRGRGIGR